MEEAFVSAFGLVKAVGVVHVPMQPVAGVLDVEEGHGLLVHVEDGGLVHVVPDVGVLGGVGESAVEGGVPAACFRVQEIHVGAQTCNGTIAGHYSRLLLCIFSSNF